MAEQDTRAMFEERMKQSPAYKPEMMKLVDGRYDFDIMESAYQGFILGIESVNTVAHTPLSADEIKEPKNGESWRVEWWNESLRMMLPSDKVLHRFNAYRNGTLQFTLKARTSGITE